MKRKYKKVILLLAAIILLIGIAAFSVSIYTVKVTEKNVFTADTYKSADKADCILILGGGVRNGKPSPMLRDRLLTGIGLYESGAADKIIMSGDHGREDYDEVNVMRAFALERGVKSEDIFLDHAGFQPMTAFTARKIFSELKIL